MAFKANQKYPKPTKSLPNPHLKNILREDLHKLEGAITLANQFLRNLFACTIPKLYCL